MKRRTTIQTVDVCACVHVCALVCILCYGRNEVGDVLGAVVNVHVSSLSDLTGLAAKVARNDSVVILAEMRRNEAL